MHIKHTAILQASETLHNIVSVRGPTSDIGAKDLHLRRRPDCFHNSGHPGDGSTSGLLFGRGRSQKAGELHNFCKFTTPRSQQQPILHLLIKITKRPALSWYDLGVDPQDLQKDFRPIVVRSRQRSGQVLFNSLLMAYASFTTFPELTLA
jgi:hypothetical protein